MTAREFVMYALAWALLLAVLFGVAFVTAIVVTYVVDVIERWRESRRRKQEDRDGEEG